jgi:hypothetical protein
MSDEVVCEDCNVTARYLAGSGGEQLNGIMDSLSNRRAYETKRWLGNGLVGLGVIACVQLSRIRSRLSI